MTPTVKAGLTLGILVGLWTLLMGVTGWYKDPLLTNVFFVVILIEIGVLIWGLKMTGKEAAYGKQIWNGTLIAIIGSIVIFCVSYLFTSVLYPNYFQDLQGIHEQMLREQGKTPEEIATLVSASKAAATPLMNALTGMFATVVTGFLASLVIGIFFRKKV